MSKPAPKTTGKPQPIKKLEKAVEFAAATSNDTPRLRVNANVRTDLHRKLKVYAATKGLSMGELIEEWIENLPTPKP